MIVVLTLLALAQPATPDALFDAARSGDRAQVARLLDAGVDVNALARYNATALMFASDKGHLDVVRLLVERGANVNGEDTFYRFKAIDLALNNGHRHVATFLLERGARGAAGALTTGIRAGDEALVKAALASADLTPIALAAAAAAAQKGTNAAIAELVAKASAARPVEAAPGVTVPAETLRSYAGTYRNQDSGLTATVAPADNAITLTVAGQPPLTFTPIAGGAFAAAGVPNLTVSFGGRAGMVESMAVVQGGQQTILQRLVIAADAAAASAGVPGAAADIPAASVPDPARPRSAPAPWPSFRGANAAGVADGQGAVAEWDVATGQNIRWKTPIPGIAVSSPVIWGDRVFVTTAVGTTADQTFRTGLYGDVKPVDDLTPHTWRMYAVDRRSGAVLWQRDVFTGEPKVKRHTKSSQASSTPVTDGTHVVAVFGTIGLLAAYRVDGTPLWQQSIGVVDNGWFFDPTYQWGHSSSPVIYKNAVIVQVDQQKGSYLAAYDVATGKRLWKTERPDEISTWGTPTIVSGPRGDEIVTNGTKARGYDAATGKLLWTLGPNSEITVGTPVAGKDLVYITGGYPPVRPVYAVRPGASGDISLAKGETSNAAIAWSNDREGTYIPTPLLYEGLLYTVNSNGILTSYDAASGERVYRARVGGGAAMSASPVAADGRLYFATEDGDVYVARAGRTYVELGKRPMNEVIMATPAISDGVIVIRTLGHLYGIGAPTAAQSAGRPR